MMIPRRTTPPILIALVLAAAGLAQSAFPQTPSPESLIEAGHWRRAKAAAEAMLKANPNDPRAQFLMSRCLDAAGDLDGALALAEKASERDPRNPDGHALLAYINGRRAQGAGVLRQVGLARRIRKEAEAALALDPRHVEAHLILIEFYRQAPGIVGGDKDRARQLAEELVAIAPARGYIVQAGFLRREAGSAGKVEELYKKAVAAEPSSYQALTTLAGYYASGREKRFAEGEALAREAMRLQPDRAAAYGLLAQAYAAQARFADLEVVLREAETNVPDNPAPFLQAGRAVFQQGSDYARAEALIRKYLSRPPELGAPSHAQAWWRLGLALEKLGRKSEAVVALRKAVALDPKLEGAKRDLKRF
ncbi:MAG: tetratricopeptide repeat protein [Candidatus Aminicenantes bacterium]|nr:tetratricopeptide repeat protein [Candidatus Aminicenantes bacterium]